MKAVNYNWFANKADEIGVDDTVSLAVAMGRAIKVAACFAKLYSGEINMIQEWIKHQAEKKRVNALLRAKRCEKHTDRRKKLLEKSRKKDY